MLPITGKMRSAKPSLVSSEPAPNRCLSFPTAGWGVAMTGLKSNAGGVSGVAAAIVADQEMQFFRQNGVACGDCRHNVRRSALSTDRPRFPVHDTRKLSIAACSLPIARPGTLSGPGGHADRERRDRAIRGHRSEQRHAHFLRPVICSATRRTPTTQPQARGLHHALALSAVIQRSVTECRVPSSCSWTTSAALAL